MHERRGADTNYPVRRLQGLIRHGAFHACQAESAMIVYTMYIPVFQFLLFAKVTLRQISGKGYGMETQVVKWGNGQGIRIPRLVMNELGIRVNDSLLMEIEDGKIILRKKTFRHRSLEERAAAYGGKLGPYTEYDWGDPEGREVL